MKFAITCLRVRAITLGRIATDTWVSTRTAAGTASGTWRTPTGTLTGERGGTANITDKEDICKRNNLFKEVIEKRISIFFSWRNGNEYLGDWRDGRAHGRGEFRYGSGPRRGERYEGQFANGVKEGFGTYYYPDGRSFVGEYRVGFGRHWKINLV